MTNAELIQKIRAEIERLKGIGGIIPLDNREQKTGYESALIDVETLLSTLESEKPINLDDAMKELDEKIALVKQRGTWKGVDVDKYMNEVRGREPEKPMNLEEEINRYLHEECSDDDEPGIHEIAEHFAEWGYLRAAEKYDEIEYNRQRAEELEKPMQDELEKEMDRFFETMPVLEHENIFDVTFQNIARHFTEWQREQMLKGAVEGIAHPDDCEIWVNLVGYGHDIKDGDKVRIIIVKE